MVKKLNKQQVESKCLEIFHLVCEAIGVNKEIAIKPGRKRENVIGRQVSMYIAKRDIITLNPNNGNKLTLYQIAEVFQKDHVTVLKAIANIQELLDSNDWAITNTIHKYDMKRIVNK